MIRSPDFGGASVTIPLKLDIMPLLDEIAEEAQIIGAVNTIVPVDPPSPLGKSPAPPKLIGRNTDYLGMVHCLRRAGAFGGTRSSSGIDTDSDSALVIGGGGTARAAIYALHSMGYTPIYLLGRQVSKVKKMVGTFPTGYDVRVLDADTENGAEDLGGVGKGEMVVPKVAIGTIPADRPIDERVGRVLQELFTRSAAPKEEDGASAGAAGGVRVLLEMAYKPRLTALMQMAEKAGWVTVPGWEALVGQGMWQYKYWTGIMPLLEDCRVSQ